MYHRIIRKISNFKFTYWFSKSLASQNSVNGFPFGASILNSLVIHFYGIEEIFDIIWEVFSINGNIFRGSTSYHKQKRKIQNSIETYGIDLKKKI